MARAPKLRKVLVDTRFGPAYRYVKDENIKRYGRVGKQEGESVYAKKQAVEFSKGRIQERAIAAKDLEEKYVRQYIPGEGYIWIRQDEPVSDIEKPPEQKPQPEKPTILDVRPQDTIAEVRKIESEERKARSADPVIMAASGSRLIRKGDPFYDGDIGKPKEEGVVTPESRYRGPVESMKLIPSAVEQAQAEERMKKEEAEQAARQAYAPTEETVDITAAYKTQGVPVYDQQGNIITDEKGEPLKVMTKRTRPSDVPYLYDPIVNQAGVQIVDSQGRPLYRRKAAVASVPISQPPPGTQAQAAPSMAGRDIQRVIYGTFTDDSGNTYTNIIGHSSTISGREKRIKRGPAEYKGPGSYDYGGTGDPKTKDEEAKASLKRKLYDLGVDYENMDKLIEEALARGDLKLDYRQVSY